MAQEILIPKLGLTMSEGVLEEWIASPGSKVVVGDILMRLSTDKVDVDVEAEGEGVLHAKVPAGSVLPPGAVVGWLLAEGEAPPEDRAGPPPVAEAAETAEAAAPEALPSVGGEPVRPGGRLLASPNARRVASELGVDVGAVRGTGPGGRVVSEDVEELAARQAESEPAGRAAAPDPGDRRASPVVRRFARDRGVDLAGVTATGPNGKISRDDVERAAAARAGAASRPAESPGRLIPFTGVRGAVARNMMASLHGSAQLTLGREVDVTSLFRTRSTMKSDLAGTDRRIPTITDFIVRAAALALLRHPLLNAKVRDDGVELCSGVHVGLAVSLDAGLVVPVIRDAATRSIYDISAEAARLAGRAREGRLELADLEGATFAVTSLGTAGIDFFTPIISPGNAAILGVGRRKDGVVWEGGTPQRSDVLTLSLTFDHRAVDGAPAAEFLATVADLLGRPFLLLD